MYQYFHNSMIYKFNNTSGIMDNSRLLDIYNNVEQCILSTYNSWLQDKWDIIIKEESVRGYSCNHFNILNLDIAKCLVWDIFLLKLHIPLATNEDILNYYNVKDKAIYLNTQGIDLYKMIDCVLNYMTIEVLPVTADCIFYQVISTIPPVIASLTDVPNLPNYGNLQNGHVFDITLANHTTGFAFWILDSLQDVTDITSPLSGSILSNFTKTTVDIEVTPNNIVSYKQYVYLFPIMLNGSQIFTITI